MLPYQATDRSTTPYLTELLQIRDHSEAKLVLFLSEYGAMIEFEDRLEREALVSVERVFAWVTKNTLRVDIE